MHRRGTADHDDRAERRDTRANREPSTHDHFHSLQRLAGNQAVQQLAVQRARYFPAVAVASLTAAQAATELAYGELPAVTFTYTSSYIAKSDTKKKSGAARVDPGFGEEYKPSTGNWVLHTHRGPGGGLLKAHTKTGSFTDDHADVDKKKVVEKGYLKDPDSSKKPPVKK